MTYLVNFTVRAERDLALIFDAINAEHSDAAVKWYSGLKEAILSLEEQPNRCPETPETPKLRQLLYGHKPHVYRVIYRVTEKRNQVDVLHTGMGHAKGSSAPTSRDLCLHLPGTYSRCVLRTLMGWTLSASRSRITPGAE